MVWLRAKAPPREGAVLVLAGNQLQESLGVERLGGGHGARAGDVLGGGHEEAGGEAVDVTTLAQHGGPTARTERLGQDAEPRSRPHPRRGSLGKAIDERPEPGKDTREATDDG